MKNVQYANSPFYNEYSKTQMKELALDHTAHIWQSRNLHAGSTQDICVSPNVF